MSKPSVARDRVTSRALTTCRHPNAARRPPRRPGPPRTLTAAAERAARSYVAVTVWVAAYTGVVVPAYTALVVDGVDGVPGSV